MNDIPTQRSGASVFLKVGDTVEARRGNYAFMGEIISIVTSPAMKLFVRSRDGDVQSFSPVEVVKVR